MELKDSFVGRLNGARYFRTFKTESYVSVPPARLITDERGNTWTLGYQYRQEGDRFEWVVQCNDRNMGEVAEKMDYRAGVLRIYGSYGRKTWNGRTFI